MRNEELSVAQAHFEYDIEKIARLRDKCEKVSVIGQPRAMSALEMGMNVNAKGYNIYISGEDGTGRHTAVHEIARRCKLSDGAVKMTLSRARVELRTYLAKEGVEL